MSIETKLRVRYAETDQMGMVHHASYIIYYECSRSDATRQIGYSYDQCEKDGYIMPVVKLESKFLKPLYYEEEFTITCNVVKFPRFGMIEFEHEIFNSKNELVHKGKVTLAIINVQTQKRENGPPKFLECLKKSMQENGKL